MKKGLIFAILISMQKGFIQIPLLFVIIAGILILGGGGYYGTKKYQNYQAEKIKKEVTNQAETDAKQKSQDEAQLKKDLELEILKKEVEVLKNTKPKTIIKEVPSSQSPLKVNLQTVIKQWEPYVAYVECEFRYIDTKEIYLKQSGSGMLYFNPELHPGFAVLTNKHVITDDENYGAYSCSVLFPNYDNNIITTYDDRTLDSFSLPRNGADAAFIGINNPSNYIKSMKNPSYNYCQTTPNLGDKVVMLGFPAIGSPTGITVTQGIISGYDGDYFITDAKIDHGNSGGVAINVEDNCYLGLPTWAAAGEIESLARILKWQGIHN